MIQVTFKITIYESLRTLDRFDMPFSETEE